MGRVVSFPVHRVADAAASATAVSTWDVDDWGRDHALVRIANTVLRLRWRVEIGGDDHLPVSGPALVVVNARQFMLTPWFVALALSEHTGRPVRFVGRPDTAPIGSLARRLGGLLARPDEVATALRDGQLLVFGATGVLDPRKVGEIDHRVLGAAVATSSPVFPALVSVSPIGRDSRIEVGGAVAPPRRRRGPFAELELADRLRDALLDQLDSAGTPRTGTPLDWIPLSLSGGE